jgi:DNA gyrase subunit A
VAEIKLRNLNKDYLINRISEIKKLEAEASSLEKYLNSDEEVKKFIKKEQKEIIKKYGKPRKTEILHLEKVRFHEDKHEIEDFNLKLFITEHGYIKKVSLVSLRASNAHKLKDDDQIVQELEGSNLDDILFFTDKHQVYKLKAHELEEHKASNLGDYIPNILKLDADESVKYVLNTKNYEGYMVFAFENGKMARVPLKSYETKTNRKKLVKAYSDESVLMMVDYVQESAHYLLIRKSGVDQYTALIVTSEMIPEKASKNTVGVQIVKMKKDSCIDLVKKMSFEHIEEKANWICKKIPSTGSTIDPLVRMTEI